MENGTTKGFRARVLEAFRKNFMRETLDIGMDMGLEPGATTTGSGRTDNNTTMDIVLATFTMAVLVVSLVITINDTSIIVKMLLFILRHRPGMLSR
jgi:hypothetical protein